MTARPVADQHLLAVGQRYLANDRRRLVDFGDRQPQAGNAAAFQVELLCIADIDERQPPVEFVHADPIQSADGKALRSRQNAGRRHAALRQRDRYLVSDGDAQRSGQFDAEDDVECPAAKIAQRALLHRRGDTGYRLLLLRLNAPQFDAADLFFENQQGLAVDERRHGPDAGIRQRRIDEIRRIRQLAFDALYARVRRHREQAVLEFPLETVHDRHHDDEYGDGDRDA